MPRGKPFICWLSTEGNYHDVGLYVGDEVMFDSGEDGWVQGKIGYTRGGVPVVRVGKTVYRVYMKCSLRPVKE